MNTITVQSDHLAAALKHGVASSRSTLATLQHVRLRADGDQLRVESTDCEVWVEASMPVEAPDGFDALLNDELLRPVAALPGRALRIQADGRVTSGRSRYAIPAMPATDFPAAEDADWSRIEVDHAALRGALRAVSYTGEDQSISVAFRSVHVTQGLVWATDGKQIAAVATDYTGPTLAIPVGQVRRVLDALEQEEVAVFAANVQSGAAGALRVRGDRLTVSLRLSAGLTPVDMAQYISRVEEGDARIQIARDALLQALRRFLPFINFSMGRRGLPTVRLIHDAQGLALVDKTGEFNEPLECTTPEVSNWTVSFDPKRAIAALAVIDTETIELLPLASNGPNKLMAITPQGTTLDQVAHLLALITE